MELFPPLLPSYHIPNKGSELMIFGCVPRSWADRSAIPEVIQL